MDSNEEQSHTETAESTPTPPSFEPSKSHQLLIGILGLFVLVIAGIAGAYFVLTLEKKENSGQTACTLEARVCPDGSTVSRTGPNCEFAECPLTITTADPETADWKTYRNEEYGFEFKYPEDRELSGSRFLDLRYNQRIPAEPHDRRVLVSDAFDIWVLTYAQQLFLTEWKLQGYPPRRGGGTSLELISTTEFKDVPAIVEKSCGLGGCVEQLTFEKNDLVYAITVNHPNDPESGFDKALNTQILSTLVFSQPSEPKVNTNTADWKTHRNKEHGFEFQYPSNYTLETTTRYYSSQPAFLLTKTSRAESQRLDTSHERENDILIVPRNAHIYVSGGLGIRGGSQILVNEEYFASDDIYHNPKLAKTIREIEQGGRKGVQLTLRSTKVHNFTIFENNDGTFFTIDGVVASKNEDGLYNALVGTFKFTE